MTCEAPSVPPVLVVATLFLLATAWPASAQLGSLLSPGRLAKAHAQLEGLSNCQQCHEQGRKVTAAKCLGCHKPIADRMALRVDPQGRARRLRHVSRRACRRQRRAQAVHAGDLRSRTDDRIRARWQARCPVRWMCGVPQGALVSHRENRVRVVPPRCPQRSPGSEMPGLPFRRDPVHGHHKRVRPLERSVPADRGASRRDV